MDAEPMQNDTRVFLRRNDNSEELGDPSGRKNAAGVDARGIVPADFKLCSYAAFCFPAILATAKEQLCWSKFDSSF
jgi:hypothetical protein